MNKKIRRRLSNGLVVFVMVVGLTAVTFTTAFAAPLAMGKIEWWPIAERIIVSVGALLLLTVWQKWRERKDRKNQKNQEDQ